jgi:poly-gamma-glutamate capsule biosynthesis protein CapA/YwtB (metallophosphatase superfamily)
VTEPLAADGEGPGGRAVTAAGGEVRGAGRGETAAAESGGGKKKARRVDAERGLRGIVGAGASQVGVLGAMRARDAARPTEEDIATAERDLVIVRRHYVPPDDLPGAR